MKPEQTSELSLSIQHWEGLADETERDIASGAISVSVGAHKAQLYRDTARALRLAKNSGIPFCVCHLMPIKGETK